MTNKVIEHITINDERIENISYYTYLGPKITIGKASQKLEIDRQSWAAY